MTTKKKINCVMLVLIVGLMTSCNDWVSENPPVNQLTTKEVFADSKSAIAALSNVYTLFNLSLAGNYNNHISLYADEMIYNGAMLGTKEFLDAAVSVDNRTNLNCWKHFYSVIYQCNFILENSQSMKGVSEDQKQLLRGESYFLRAYAYFFLVNLYGEVPLLTQTDVSVTSLSPSSPVAAIYRQIETDLVEAEILLPVEYPVGEKVRANKMAATALLAKVYLYEKKYTEAAERSSTIIENGMYKLEPLNDVFKLNSKETILQFWTQDGFPNFVSFFNPITGTARFVISAGLDSAFEKNDERRAAWIKASSGVLCAYKYKNNTAVTGESSEYLVALRLAEQYLIRAEARLFTNDLPGALTDVNKIRFRAKLPALPPLNSEKMLLAIEQERRVELFCEWGDRFFDLKRYGKVDGVLEAIKPGWSSERRYLPIPFNELKNNPNLTQNEGY